MELKANSRGKTAIKIITLRCKEIANRTVGEIFAYRGFPKETPELIRRWDASVERYFG